MSLLSQGVNDVTGAISRLTSQAGGAFGGASDGMNSAGNHLGRWFDTEGAKAGDLGQNPWQMISSPAQHLFGQGFVNAFNPGSMGVHNAGLFQRPWAAARLAMGLPLLGMMGAGAFGTGGLQGMTPGMQGLGANSFAQNMGLGMGIPGANEYSAFRKRIGRLDDARNRDAYAARNATFSQAGANGISGSVVNARAGQSANDVLARYAAMKKAVTDEYMGDVTSQLGSFMSLFGFGGGMGANLLPFAQGQGGGY